MGHLNVKQLEKAEEKALYIKYLINYLKALDIMIKSGLSKKQRKDKARLDRLSAVLILQRYLKHI